MVSRRDFFGAAGAAAVTTTVATTVATAVNTAAVSRAGAASLPEAVVMDKAATQPPLAPPNALPKVPVIISIRPITPRYS